jgi:hypothetical protein
MHKFLNFRGCWIVNDRLKVMRDGLLPSAANHWLAYISGHSLIAFKLVRDKKVKGGVNLFVLTRSKAYAPNTSLAAMTVLQ